MDLFGHGRTVKGRCWIQPKFPCLRGLCRRLGASEGHLGWVLHRKRHISSFPIITQSYRNVLIAFTQGICLEMADFEFYLNIQIREIWGTRWCHRTAWLCLFFGPVMSSFTKATCLCLALGN